MKWFNRYINELQLKSPDRMNLDQLMTVQSIRLAINRKSLVIVVSNIFTLDCNRTLQIFDPINFESTRIPIWSMPISILICCLIFALLFSTETEPSIVFSTRF